MTKALFLTTLAALLVGCTDVSDASDPQGDGQGHYDYQGRGLDQLNHGHDTGCPTCLTPPSNTVSPPASHADASIANPLYQGILRIYNEIIEFIQVYL